MYFDFGQVPVLTDTQRKEFLMQPSLATYWRDFLDLLFPRTCEACEQALLSQEVVICTDCRITLPRTATDNAMLASLPLKFAAHRELVGVDAYLAFTKKGKVQNLLHGLKYKARPEIGVLLGQMMAQDMIEKKAWPEADLIVSVPLHKKRKRERGYNQSDAFAEGLSAATGVPWSGTALQRVKYTKSQTGKTKTERRENVSGIFAVSNQVDLQNQKIILVDDVLTTGATLEACMEAMTAAGCRHIHIMTIAAAQQ